MKYRNRMEKKGLKPYFLAKYASKELLVEELVLSKGGAKSYYLEKYIHHPFRLKLKVIFTKLFFAITFGVIPVLPLLTYFEIVRLISQGSPSIETVYFIGGLLFSLYFSLQFLSFFIMGMLDTAMITSGKIFEWFETLPISRKKFLRIVYLTLFRSYDLPIIVLVIAFPITMLIGSQSIVIFLVCLGISLINMVLSFSILLIFGERINRILDINDKSSKKTLIIRLFNILSYIFIVIIGYVLIQWFLGSLQTFYILFTDSEYQPITNIILSIIPFPLNSSFLISLFIAPNQASLQLWISSLIGFALLIIITYGISRKAFKAIERISISKLKTNYLIKPSRSPHLEVEVIIKSSKTFIAYLRKDLRIITRDLKVFMSIIMPIMLSFIFIVAFGIKNIETVSLIDRGFFQNWIGILTFSPILSGLIVYSLMNIENLGESIIAALPIIPRNQAKPKLFLIYIIQTCATLLPSLLFLNSPNFIAIFINFLFTLPFAWLFLLIIFILRVNFFGKKRPKFYVLDDYNPKNRMYKWTLIVSVPYILFFWITSFGINFLYQQDNNSMIFLFWAVIILGFLISLLLFNIMLPVYQRESITKLNVFNKGFFSNEEMLKKNIKPTIFSKHIWFSIVILLIINFFLFFLVSFIIAMLNSLIDPYYYYYFPRSFIRNLEIVIQILLVILIPNLIYGFILLYFIPKYVGLPYGKQPFKQNLDCTGLSWLKSFFSKKYFKTILFTITSIFIMYFITQSILGILSLNLSYLMMIISLLSLFTFCFWQEILHRGIILTMLVGKYSQKWALVLQTFITIILKAFFYIIPIFPGYLDPGISHAFIITTILYDFICSSFISLILGYIYLKNGSLLPGLISTFILTIFLPISFFIPFLPISLFIMPSY